MKTTSEQRIIEIRVTGDPYGRGFEATEYENQAEYETEIGMHRGDIGARPRQWWRDYCRQFGIILRYS